MAVEAGAPGRRKRDNEPMNRRSLAPGEQPYDFANGIRVGGIAGALVGGGVGMFTGWPAWVLVGAVVGGIGGYAYQRRDAGRSEAD